ncbi:hypothetical protein Godav_029667 [Gossypium davidsonii]|uniref:Uncharacterized protein n=1 Tax=Gossypium davidsonii TaxID=34287 RepID=A0A7J8TGU1_GOSDV|nr:hypothetical protein [Gossypium davidsonii]
MEREFFGKVEDNAAVQVWSKKVQQEKGDSLVEGYVSELWDFTHICVTQNSLQELKEICDPWDNEIKKLFYSNYGDLPYLLDVDLVPIVEEYTTLLQCLRIQVDKAYLRVVNVPTFLKKLMSITGMSEQWVAAQIEQKGDSKCIPSKNLRDLILAHPDSHLEVEKVSYRVFSKNYSPLKELVATPRRDDITEEKRMVILQNLQEEDVEWKAPWMVPNEILYR